MRATAALTGSILALATMASACGAAHRVSVARRVSCTARELEIDARKGTAESPLPPAQDVAALADREGAAPTASPEPTREPPKLTEEPYRVAVATPVGPVGEVATQDPRHGGEMRSDMLETNPGVRTVIVNGQSLGEEALLTVDRILGAPMPSGSYWYDRMSGAWGARGGPCAGVTIAGLDLGGRLAADASNGATGVFVNGRELPAQETFFLSQELGPISPGRYWVDGTGNCGLEGGAPIVNLYAVMSSRGNGNGRSWSHHSSNLGAGVGGDGQGFTYYIDKDTSYTGQ